MESIATIKCKTDYDGNKTGEIRVELYSEGTVQLIKTPEQHSYFICRDEALKFADALQQASSRVPMRSETLSTD